MQSTWRSPSNIALVKYWGKYANQIPANPSISFTLSQSYTQTTVSIEGDSGHEGIDFDLYLDGELKPEFKDKVQQFIERIKEELGPLQGKKLKIETHNSFPHSSGIASSASGMSALALCLLDLRSEIGKIKELDFERKASEWARLGSGSASRSVYGPLGQWGEFSGIPESSDEYAIPYQGEVAPVFQDFQDCILLVEKGQKQVSSTAGHGLMNNHPFAKERFKQAHRNLEELLSILKSGDIQAFGNLVESEALTLHAMMMSSNPYFILMKPNTLQIIEAIWAFRKETEIPAYFTLDAGANVHLLFPKAFEQKVLDFVNQIVLPYLKNGEYICDRVGHGPEKISI